MADVAAPVLDPQAVVGTGAFIAAAPKMELGALSAGIVSAGLIDYAFGALLVEPAFGATSPLVDMQIVLGTQQFSRDYVARAMLASAWARQGTARSLADELEHDTEHLSVIRRAAHNPIFGRLAQLGPAATVIALQRLTGQNRPLWLLFLQRTSAERPARGTASVDDAAGAWREWGKRQGLV